MTRNEVEKFGAKLAQYIIEELESYNLYFDFGAPQIQILNLPHEAILHVKLWGYKLPEDVSPSDEEVLTKFLEHIFNEFVVSYDIDYSYCDYECYIYDKAEDDVMSLFEISVNSIKTER